MGAGSLARAEKIENYYGVAQPISGEQLHKNGIEQALALGAELVEDEVVALRYDGETFEANTSNGKTISAQTVLLATGTARSVPKIDGIVEFEGRGVSYCAVCDAFFYRGKDVCVLGNGEYAAHEAAELAPLVRSVTVLTDGSQLSAALAEGVAHDERKIAAIEGGERLASVRFADGNSITADGVFVAYGTAGSAALARSLGAVVEGANIAVDGEMATSIAGLFAAGDCVGGLLQVAKAVHDGAVAGMSAIKFLRQQDKSSETSNVANVRK